MSSQQNWKYPDPIRNASLFAWVWMLKSVIPAGNYQISLQPTPCRVFVWFSLSAAGRSCVWTSADDDCGNLTFPKHYCSHSLLLQIFDLINLHNPQLCIHDKGLWIKHKGHSGPQKPHLLVISWPAHLRFTAQSQHKPWSNPRQLTLPKINSRAGKQVDSDVWSKGLSQCGHMRNQVWLVLSDKIKKPILQVRSASVHLNALPASESR